MHHATGHIEECESNNGIIYPKEVATRIRILQRIVQTIAVAVEALAVVWQLHVVVGTEEATEHGIVQTTIHIDDAEIGKHFVTRITAVQVDVVTRHRLLAPSVVRGFEHFLAVVVDNAQDAAEVVRKRLVELELDDNHVTF